MYCGKCGTQNDDSAKFCANCGESLHSGSTPKAPKKNSHRIIGIIAVALAAVTVLLLGMSLFGGRSAEDTCEQLLEALNDLDMVQVHALFPEPVQKLLVAGADASEEEYEQLLIEKNNSLRVQLSSLGSSIEWSLGNPKDVSADRLLELKNQYMEDMGISISGAKSVTVTLYASVLGFTQSQNSEAVLIQYKGSWYVDYYSVGDLL